MVSRFEWYATFCLTWSHTLRAEEEYLDSQATSPYCYFSAGSNSSLLLGAPPANTLLPLSSYPFLFSFLCLHESELLLHYFSPFLSSAAMKVKCPCYIFLLVSLFFFLIIHDSEVFMCSFPRPSPFFPFLCLHESELFLYSFPPHSCISFSSPSSASMKVKYSCVLILLPLSLHSSASVKVMYSWVSQQSTH